MWRVPPLEPQHSPADLQFGAGREGRVEGEEEDGFGDLLRRSEALRRNPVLEQELPSRGLLLFLATHAEGCQKQERSPRRFLWVWITMVRGQLLGKGLNIPAYSQIASNGSPDWEPHRKVSLGVIQGFLAFGLEFFSDLELH